MLHFPPGLPESERERWRWRGRERWDGRRQGRGVFMRREEMGREVRARWESDDHGLKKGGRQRGGREEREMEMFT